MDSQGTRIYINFLKKKNKVGRLRFPDFKIYYKALVIIRVWYWHKDIYIEYNREPINKTSCIWSNDL